MPDTITQLSETLIRALGHSLWQAALICGIVWLLLRSLPAKHAERRYAIALAQSLRVAMISQAMKHGNKDAGPKSKGNGILERIESRKDCQVRGQTT